ncbi:MAG: glycosyltransferase [Actinomycetota bacterium]
MEIREDRTLSEIARVAMVVVHANPLAEPGAGDAGGMGVYVREMAKALARSGREVDIYTRLDQSGPHIETSPFPGVQVIPVRAGDPCLPKEQLPEHLPEFVSCVAAAAQERFAYDIVHSHYWLSGKVATALKNRWGIPFVHTFHTLGLVKNGALSPGEPAEPPGRLWGEAGVIEQACAIVASSYQERQSLVDLYAAHPDRIYMVPPGVDHAMFRPEPGYGAPNRLKAPLLLFVGRLQPLKGASIAIRAAAILARSYPGLRLVIAGGPSGPGGEAELEHLKALAAQLGLAGSVDFKGPVPQIQLGALYRQADVCLVPSQTESFGLVALEAQACGVPVVASSVGGLKSIVRHGETGFLAVPGSPESFAVFSEQILSNPETKARMAAAAARSSLVFSWDRSAETLLDVYEESTQNRECSTAITAGT